MLVALTNDSAFYNFKGQIEVRVTNKTKVIRTSNP